MKTPLLKTPKQASKARHVDGVSFFCHDCKQVLPVQTSGGTGYAKCTDPDGRERLVCYACTDKRTREDMKTATRFCAYVSSTGARLTTWTGGDLGQVFFGARHPWSNRHDDRRLCPSTLPTDYPAAANAIRAQVKAILRRRSETLDTIAEHKAALA